MRFVVTDGLAVAGHGPERQANDIDLLVNPTAGNSACFAKALWGLHLTGFSSTSLIAAGFQVQLKQTFYAELLTPQLGACSFSEVDAEAVNAQLLNIPLRLASPRTLIKMKKLAITLTAYQCDKHSRDIELENSASDIATEELIEEVRSHRERGREV